MSSGEETECPICTNIPTGKIFQCREGHIVCEACLRQIQEHAIKANSSPTCPSCNASVDDSSVSRNRILESILDRLTLDCQNVNSGCEVKLKRSNIKHHEKTCLYGQSFEVCSKFFNVECDFKLSVSTAHNIWQHINSCHPSIKVLGTRVNWNAYISRTVWGRATAAGRKLKSYSYILQVPGSEKYIMIFDRISKDSVSFCSVDLSLGLSVTDNLRVAFSVPNETAQAMSWSIPVAYGIDSWKYLLDESHPSKIEIGIKPLLQHCDEEGKLKMFAEVKKFNITQ